MIADVVRTRLVFIDVAIPHDQQYLVFVDERLKRIVGQLRIVVALVSSSPSMEEVNNRVLGSVAGAVGSGQVEAILFIAPEGLAEVGQVPVRVLRFGWVACRNKQCAQETGNMN